MTELIVIGIPQSQYRVCNDIAKGIDWCCFAFECPNESGGIFGRIPIPRRRCNDQQSTRSTLEIVTNFLPLIQRCAHARRRSSGMRLRRHHPRCQIFGNVFGIARRRAVQNVQGNRVVVVVRMMIEDHHDVGLAADPRSEEAARCVEENSSRSPMQGVEQEEVVMMMIDSSPAAKARPKFVLLLLLACL